MLRRLLAAAICIIPSLAWGASSNVNSLTSSGAIVGSQQLYCPTTGAAADFKCTFTQVDAFINAQFSGDMTANGTGTTTVGSIGGKAVALGAALTTTGAGATTLAFGASTQTYTFPSATATLLGNAFPMTVSGTTTSGGVPYFSSTTGLSSSAALAANAIVLGGGAGAAPASTTTGSGVVTAIGSGVNTNGGLATATTTSVVAGAINTGGGSGTAPVGLADVATGSYLQSGGVTTIPAWQAFGTGAQTAIDTAVNTTGGVVTQSGTLAASALLIGGGAASPVTSTTTGAGVLTALGIAPLTTGSFTPQNGAITNNNCLKWSTTLGVTDSGAGCAGAPSYPLTVAGTVTSGGIPYFNSTTQSSSSALLAANAIMIGGGAGAAPATTTTGTGVLTALASAPNASGGFASAAAPLTVGTGGSITGADGYYVCTTTCAITLPTPAAGFQFCVRNDSAVTTVITISAITSVQFEKTTYNGYGTVTTGTMVSGGALGDKICLVGRDSTHYLVGSYVGTWTNS